MTASPTIQPKETENLDIYGSPPLEWERVVGALNTVGDRDYADAASRFWIATTRPDGAPHLMAVGIVWDAGRFYLCTGAGTQKSRNLANDPRCTVSIAAPGMDIVAEGEAKVIRDEAELNRIAELCSDWVRRCATARSATSTARRAPVRRPGTSTRSPRPPSTHWPRPNHTARRVGGCLAREGAT
jgi:hypothetical protein